MSVYFRMTLCVSLHALLSAKVYVVFIFSLRETELSKWGFHFIVAPLSGAMSFMLLSTVSHI